MNLKLDPMSWEIITFETNPYNSGVFLSGIMSSSYSRYVKKVFMSFSCSGIAEIYCVQSWVK